MTNPDSDTHSASSPRRIVALVGNPNTGKTSLFNALTGFRRHVANYPGVTVDAAAGPLRGSDAPIELLDLPGTYSLSAESPDEMIVTRVLSGEQPGQARPDAIVCVADATNLPRNLFLLSQVLAFGLPTVLAVNMMDVADARGIELDFATLAERLGIPVVPITATRPATLALLKQVICSAAAGQLRAGEPPHIAVSPGDRAAEVRARYAWLGRTLADVVKKPLTPVRTWSDRIDAILTHRVFGVIALLAVLFLVFQAIYQWAGPLMDAISGFFDAAAGIVGSSLPEGALKSLIADGLISGIGGVLVFLPQILILFAFIAILEDCGYLARAAYMVDRLMRSLGLSGRAFIPLLSSFACAVPAIMGTRTISDRRERFVTILIAPFMSCSARLPVYVLLIAAFVPDEKLLGGVVSLPALVLLAMYLIGAVVAVPIAWLLKSTVFRGPQTAFILELPSYKWPRPAAVLQRMYFAGRKFVVAAGSVILLVNLIVWALGYFPRSEATLATVDEQRRVHAWDDETYEKELAAAYLRESYLGRAGHFIEPAVKPLGWDWRIGVAVIASLPAREVVVATMGTIYGLGGDEDEESVSLRDAIQAATWPDTKLPVFTLPVALSLMVFFALCAQCSSTLVVIGRETQSWLWPMASFVGMTAIAYLAAWGTYAAGAALGW